MPSKYKPFPNNRRQHLEFKLVNPTPDRDWGEWYDTGKPYPAIDDIAISGFRVNFCKSEIQRHFGKIPTNIFHIRFSKVQKTDDVEYLPLTLQVKEHHLSWREAVMYSLAYNVRHGVRRLKSGGLRDIQGVFEEGTADIFGKWLGEGVHEIWVAGWYYE